MLAIQKEGCHCLPPPLPAVEGTGAQGPADVLHVTWKPRPPLWMGVRCSSTEQCYPDSHHSKELGLRTWGEGEVAWKWRVDLGFDLGFGATDQSDEKLCLYCAYTKTLLSIFTLEETWSRLAWKWAALGAPFCRLSVHKGDLKETWRESFYHVL